MQLFNPVLGSFQNNAAVSTSLRGAITYAAGTTGAIGVTTLFTVTGDVAITLLAAKCTSDLTSAGLPVFDVGVAGATTIFANGMPDVTGWDAGEWVDMANGTYGVLSIDNNAVGRTTGEGVPVSLNIIQTIGTATITGGVVRWYLRYRPLSADGAVALHANLVAF